MLYNPCSSSFLDQLTVTVVVEPEGSASLIPKLVVGHDLELVSTTFYPQMTFLRSFLMLSSHHLCL